MVRIKYLTKSGFIFEIDDTEGNTRLRIKQVSGNEQVSDHDGNFTEDIKGNETRTVEGDVDETLNGSLTIDVENSVTIRAPEMTFGESDAVQESLLGANMRKYLLDHLHYYINQQLIVTGNLGAPSSTVINPIQPGEAAESGDIYSKVNKNQ